MTAVRFPQVPQQRRRPPRPRLPHQVREVCRERRCNDRYEIIEEEVPVDEVYELDTSRDIYIDLEDRDDLQLEEKSGFEALGSAIEQRGGTEVTSSLTNITKTKGNEDYWVEVPLTEEASEITVQNRETASKSAFEGKNKLCIMAQQPYTRMNAKTFTVCAKPCSALKTPTAKRRRTAAVGSVCFDLGRPFE